MSSSKKIYMWRDFAAGVYLSEATSRKGGGEEGRDEPEKRLERQQFTKWGRKFQHDWLYLKSINSDKHLSQSPFTGQFFRWRHLALVSL